MSAGAAVDRKNAVLVRLGIAELEARLDVSRVTIWRWLRAGRFPQPEWIGERRAWRLDALEAWERERAARPASERLGGAHNLPKRVAS